jgi:hypothetical protein
MFLRPGLVPGPGWIDDVITLARQGTTGAAVFSREALGFFVRLFNRLPHPDQGLLLRKSFYAELGGHRAQASDAEADLIRRIGARRLIVVRTKVSSAII